MKNEELNKAIAVFLMGFGSRLPSDMKESIRSRIYHLADEVERAGEPTVGMLARGFADALAAPPPDDATH